MKRTPLTRKTGLSRKTSLSSSSSPDRKAVGETKPSRKSLRRVIRRQEPGEAAWKRRRSGTCRVCNRYGPVVLHHLVREQDIRKATTKQQQADGIVWDRRNAFQIGAPFIWGGKCRCHDKHTTPGTRDDDRLEFKIVPPEALAFAVEVLGEGPAIEYWRRNYRNAP